MTQVWMCRGGKDGEYEEYLLDNEVTGSGWTKVPDLSAASTFEDVREVIAGAYVGESKHTIGNWAGQLWTLLSMSPGDYVLMPRKGQGAVAIGKVTGPYRYDASADPGFRHLRSVQWLATEVPQTSIGPDIRGTLGAFMTLCAIRKDDVVARVEALATGKADPRFDAPETVVAEAGEGTVAAVASVTIEELIRTQFPGHELAALVEAVLQANGYETRLSPPGPDGGVDVLAAKGGLGFDGPRIAVQVKNTGGAQGVKELNELLGAQARFGAERSLFVSWGGFTGEGAKLASTKWFELRLWTAEDLVREITAVYSRLPESFRSRMPLKQVWTSARSDEAE